MEEDSVVKDMSDIDVLTSLYCILSTPISKKWHSRDFNECVERLGQYINKISKNGNDN